MATLILLGVLAWWLLCATVVYVWLDRASRSAPYLVDVEPLDPRHAERSDLDELLREAD